MPERSLDELARELDAPAERIHEVLMRTLARLPRARYYVFRIASDTSGTPATPEHPRTVAAFPSPDDALAFAQRNGYAASTPIRPLPTRELLALTLSDPTIGALLFVEGTGIDEAGGSLPRGIKISREDLLAEIARPEMGVKELTAAAYDQLQFGVDFAARGTFRAALTAAVEAVVAGYRPPPGSLDTGSRSVFATSEVEMWLRRNGFPRATQRRWVSVAGEGGWHGAEELYEIDCGAEQRLFVQLLIYSDGQRQYIGHVVVTS